MGTPIWGDSPPLVYFAEPVDKASGQNFAVAAAMHNALATWGCNTFRPAAGFRTNTPDPRVEQINRDALYRADVIVAYLSETTPSIGVPAEIEAATSRGIPAVVHYTGQSFVLAGNPLVTVITDTNSLIGAVEHALKEHPRKEVHETENGWCHVCGGIGLEDYEHRPRRQTVDLPVNNLNRLLELAANPVRYVTGDQVGPYSWQKDIEPIRVVLAEGAQPPHRAYPDDAGLDLTTDHEVTIQPGEYKDVRTQVVASQLPTGYHAQITGRSSALRKWRLHIPVAIIDPGWRGPLYVGVWNLGGNPVTLRPGDRVGQLILIPNTPAPVQIVTPDQLDPHPRGLNGFGSSG